LERKSDGVVALRAPPVPLPGINILQTKVQIVKTYRTSLDDLHYRLFTMLAGKLR